MQCKHFLSDKQTDNSLIIANECQNTRKVGNYAGFNTRSSEIQGTELGKVPTGMACIDRSMPAGVAQSSHVFVFVLFLNSLLHLPLVENDLACLDTRVMLPQPHEQRYPLDDLRKSKGLHSVSAYRH